MKNKTQINLGLIARMTDDYKNTKALCAQQKRCGGCQLQHLNYEGQLYVKQRYVKQLFEKYGKVSPIIGMEYPYYYRNKVHAVLKKDRWGHLTSGMFAEGSHQVIQIEQCLIENQQARQIINTIHELIRSFRLSIYDEDKREGLIRHVLMRTGHHTGEILVVIVAASRTFPSKKNFMKELLKRHPEISSIVLNINAQTNNMVLGMRDEVWYGKGYIVDELCGLKFKISPQSFYQINAVQTEKLYQKAIELAEFTGKETVIDAYCGIGTIGMIASKKAKEVLGVEVNASAIRDAKVNKALNHIDNVRFYLDDAEKFMLALAAEHRKVDVVMMDPPRAGSTKNFMNALMTLLPRRIVYISCNPATLKRDIDYLTSKSDYQVAAMIPCDMFPMTQHVEMIISLCRKSDAHN